MIRARFTSLKKIEIFYFFYLFARKTAKLGTLVIVFVLFSSSFHLSKFEFTDDYYIIDSAFDLDDIFMYRIIWTCYS